MPIVSLGDNWHELPNPTMKNKKKKKEVKMSCAEIFTQHAENYDIAGSVIMTLYLSSNLSRW